MPFIAGENLRAGDMLVVHDDGKMYLYRRENDLPNGYAPVDAPKGVTIELARFGQIIVRRRSLSYRFMHTLRKFFYRLRGKSYVRLD